MYRVLIVDDDMINRAVIVSMIDWESLGFTIVAEKNDGKSALEFLENNSVHLVITDMKMPIMDGLELITEIAKREYPVKIIALSGYNEFPLVREAFKLGVEDYILKSELTSQYITDYMEKIKKKFNLENFDLEPDTPSDLLKDCIMGKQTILDDVIADYYVLMVQAENTDSLRTRFLNLQDALIKPMKEIIYQIPKIAKYCKITEYLNTRLALCYNSGLVKLEDMDSLAKQIISVIKNYMNVDISIGISDFTKSGKDFVLMVEQADRRLSLRYIYGAGSIITQQQENKFKLNDILNERKEYGQILKCLKEFDNDNLFDVQTKLLVNKEFDDINLQKKKCLNMIYFESLMLEDNGDSIWNISGENINFEQKINRLQTSNDVVMWAFNFNRWIMDYMMKKYENTKIISRENVAKSYIQDNFADPNITLSEVASIVGLNEKYFCTVFKNKFGVSFIDFLTNVRIERAKELLNNTTMKLYEISQAVGYTNVEHFARVFKKKTGFSPGSYNSRK